MELIAATGVHALPIAAGFLIGIGAFGAWVSWMIRSSEPAPTTGRVAAGASSAAGSMPRPAAGAPAARPVAAPAAAVAGAERVIDLREDEQVRVVRAGAFCPVVGAQGVTATGALVECTSIAGARPRWLKVRAVLAKSA